MKAKIKPMNWFVRMITFGSACGITLAPFGIYIDKDYMDRKSIINHEQIHWEQQMEMFILPFYIWYGIEWFIRIFTNWGHAYLSIAFEREAYSNDLNLNYISTRSKFAWLKYLKKNKND